MNSFNFMILLSNPLSRLLFIKFSKSVYRRLAGTSGALQRGCSSAKAELTNHEASEAVKSHCHSVGQYVQALITEGIERQIFSVKGQIGNLLGFACHMISTATTQICHFVKADESSHR